MMVEYTLKQFLQNSAAWTDNTDKNLKPNKTNTTAFKN